MLFFAVPFPMILYYSINYNSGIISNGTDPWLAMLYLLISVGLWLMVLYQLYRLFIAETLKAKAKVEFLLKKGVHVDAEIVDVKVLKPLAETVESLDLTVQFNNFSGTLVRYQTQVNDSQPHLHRYETGKTIKLRVDKSLNSEPVLIPDGTTVNLDGKRLVFRMIIWAIIVLAVVGYYIFSYHLEHNDKGWRFLIFWHPLLLCPLILLFYQFGLGKLLGKLMGGPQNVVRLKFYGKKALARLLSAKQTGTYINEQPQVKFELTYDDEKGRTHQVSFKKVISLLDVGITQQKQLEVFYLEDDPQCIALSSDLEV